MTLGAPGIELDSRLRQRLSRAGVVVVVVVLVIVIVTVRAGSSRDAQLPVTPRTMTRYERC